jgi:hypothetical protein
VAMEMMHYFIGSSTQQTNDEIIDSICTTSSQLSSSVGCSVSPTSIVTMPQSPITEVQQPHQTKQYRRQPCSRYRRRGSGLLNLSNTVVIPVLLLLSIALFYGSSSNNKKKSMNGQKSGIGFVVTGFPTGAGGCQGGIEAVGGPHLDSSKNIEKGDLEFGGITFSINGIELLPNDPIRDFPLGQDIEVTVVATFPDVLFRGLLIRMEVPSSYTGDTTNLLLPSSPELKVSDVCTAPVRGITHINRGDKETASGTVNVPLEALGVIFDVTVVFANDAASSAFVYSRLLANFRGPTTDAPTARPVSLSPTPSGVLINVTEAPTTVVVGSRLPTAPPVVGVPSTSGPSEPPRSLNPTISRSPTISNPPTGTPIIGNTPTQLPTSLSTLNSNDPTITFIPTITGIPTMAPINLDSDLPSIVPTLNCKLEREKSVPLLLQIKLTLFIYSLFRCFVSKYQLE